MLRTPRLLLTVFTLFTLAACLFTPTLRAQTAPPAAPASSATAIKSTASPSATPAATPTAVTPYSLSIVTDHADAIYKQGESVVFKIKLLHDQKPEENNKVHWRISKDGVPPIQTGEAPVVNGAATVTGHLDEPGFLQCQALFQTPEKKNLTAVAGAAVDPLKIQPSMPAPDDFDAFWAAQKQKLAAIPINARLTPVTATPKGVESFDVQADCVGAPVSGYFARPAGAKPRSLPIILTVQGAGVRSSNLGGTVGFAGRGMLAMDINAHGLPNGKPDQFYKDLADGDFKDYRTRGRESRDTVYFLGMFLRLIRAIDFPHGATRVGWPHGHRLRQQPGRRAGHCRGGPRSARHLFRRRHSGHVRPHRRPRRGRVNGWPKFVPTGADGKPDAKVIEAVRYYDAVNFARRTKAPGIVAVGFIDPTCPPSSVYAAYNALNTPKEIINQPLSPHQVTAGANDAMRRAIQAHIDAAKTQK